MAQSFTPLALVAFCISLIQLRPAVTWQGLDTACVECFYLGRSFQYCCAVCMEKNNFKCWNSATSTTIATATTTAAVLKFLCLDTADVSTTTTYYLLPLLLFRLMWSTNATLKIFFDDCLVSTRQDISDNLNALLKDKYNWFFFCFYFWFLGFLTSQALGWPLHVWPTPIMLLVLL